MTNKEIEGILYTISRIIPLFFICVLSYSTISLLTFFTKHFGKEKFKLSKLVIGIMRDVVWGLVSNLGTYAFTGKFSLAFFVGSICILKGYRWSGNFIDRIAYDFLGIDRRSDKEANEK